MPPVVLACRRSVGPLLATRVVARSWAWSAAPPGGLAEGTPVHRGQSDRSRAVTGRSRSFRSKGSHARSTLRGFCPPSTDRAHHRSVPPLLRGLCTSLARRRDLPAPARSLGTGLPG